jgi:hypothetical protein
VIDSPVREVRLKRAVHNKMRCVPPLFWQ